MVSEQVEADAEPQKTSMGQGDKVWVVQLSFSLQRLYLMRAAGSSNGP